MNKNLSSLYTEIDSFLSNVVCKEEQRAKNSSTTDSEYYYGLYAKAVKMQDNLLDYTLDIITLHSEVPRLSMSKLQDLVDGIISYELELTKIEISRLLTIYRSERISNYIETNNYYRMLLGLPDIDTPETEWVYYKGLPIHKLPVELYFECKKSGYLDVVINENLDKPYLWYVYKKIDNIYAREAGQFDILWTDEGYKYTRFRECYNKERQSFLQVVHSDYLCETTDYAEARELTTLKLQAILLYRLESNSNELDKAEFSREEATKVWSEFGLSFPKDMLETYRNTTTFLLNYLNTLKGTNKSMDYISSKLFSGIKLYKYFIRKTHNTNLTFPLPEGTTPEEFYNIEFVLRPFYATNIIDTKDNNLDDKVLSYDEVVAMDPRWRDSTELKKAVFETDFSYTESKYLSLNNFIDLSEFTNTFSVLSRILIEHKDIMSSHDIEVPSTGDIHSAFNVFIYYLGLVTKFIEGKDVKIPDTLSGIEKLYGFKVPFNIGELRIKFAWFFTQSDYSWLLDEFPDAINNNDSFFSFVVNTDKVIGLESYMYDLLNSCNNWQEYDLASSLFKLVRVVSRTPSSYDILESTDGVTYKDWLKLNDTPLYNSFIDSVQTKDKFIIELDSITQLLTSMFENATYDEIDPKNITTVFTTFNLVMNGVSKYLMYVLNLFKSYSSDFLNESVSYFFGEKYETLKQITNLRIDGDFSAYLLNENTNWDSVIVSRERPFFQDTLVQAIDILLTTPYGDIKINNQGGYNEKNTN